ncbi:class I SAM-dependent methyltransferase [Mycobacterium avium subsp. hominissuis]|uniref:class I SAM-dependent methyltransferase n=1 Tax=Mycobacterium avium TaxID=1764 RepID=UPI000392736E|nr:class I SAM-dependent methyltransferase [Mycobacterium avium]ETA95544.1 ubiquinone biosynthesis protein UbiE [Mycobacterium avium 10-5581]APA74586.1 class I SAM-dependent methyltransferase [Mycobacterium avium subsp. hominissuis]ATO61552.1 class I SAM-dependent methyltransferase [Mycobacterium avium subsp. hominissuis]ATO66103.1 class I SAM-dependent methyltransferase [Mycobacterium avium subsp. hominissuis]ATO70689.2 class I SAM-dependent methyltransferase [Mycobacterium avium subsp. homin
MPKPNLPYFDYLLAELDKNNPSIEKAFGNHVHFGYWDDPSTATGSDEDYAHAADALTDQMVELADISDGHHVLDVGCGFGGTISALNDQFDSLTLTGLNIDERQIARARRQVHPRQHNSVEFRVGDACALPFPDGSFDRVLAVECIQHFRSRQVFLMEAARVLKPGGVLALSDLLPVPVFAPFCWLGTRPWLDRFYGFGDTNVSCTLRRLRGLAAKARLTEVVERNVTKQTVPTYDYLRRMNGGYRPAPRLLGTLGLLNYYLLAFEKP